MDENLLWLLAEVKIVPGVENASVLGVHTGSGRGLPIIDGDKSRGCPVRYCCGTTEAPGLVCGDWFSDAIIAGCAERFF